jgi:hypothetical protein
MGVDRGIHVEISGPEYDTLQPIHVSKILAKLAQDEKADIVIVGKQVNEQFLHCFITSCNLFTARHIQDMVVVRFVTIPYYSMSYLYAFIHLILIFTDVYLYDAVIIRDHKQRAELLIFILGFGINWVKTLNTAVRDLVVEEI